MELSDHSGSWAEENEDAWDEHHPRVLIPEMCKLFYTLGWYEMVSHPQETLCIHSNL